MRLIIILGLIGILNVYGQNDSCILIRYPNYKVTLFQGNYAFKDKEGKVENYAYQCIYGIYAHCKPWTPSVVQIRNLELKIKKIIENYKSNIKLDSTKNADLKYIIKNINNYNRRYFCCINKYGKKILYINFYIRKDNDNLNLPDTNLFNVIGGGKYYFNITYNFDLKRVVDLNINAPW